jgi:hypothetical protein
VRIAFQGPNDRTKNFSGPIEVSTFGSPQYRWHPALTKSMAHADTGTEHTITAYTKGSADPDGPIARGKVTAGKDSSYELPAASVTVIRGKISE